MGDSIASLAGFVCNLGTSILHCLVVASPLTLVLVVEAMYRIMSWMAFSVLALILVAAVAAPFSPVIIKLFAMWVIVEGGGKLIEGTGKVVIEGGGKVVDGAGKVIGGAGVAIGKAVGDVVIVTLGPDTSAEPFRLPDLYGNKVSLSDFKGSPVLLIFCTTNYAPCVVEMRHLRDLQEKYAEDGLKVIAVAMDWEGPASLRNFAEKMDINYPILWDNGSTFKKYTSLSRVPTTFFIDRNGNIWKKRVGFRSAMIITGGGQFLGSSMVEMDKDFEKDVIDLLSK